MQDILDMQYGKENVDESTDILMNMPKGRDEVTRKQFYTHTNSINNHIHKLIIYE
jgi:hypothetical protein